MPTILTHAVAALSIGACFRRPEVPKGVWVLGAFYAALPDADVAAFSFGIPYENVLGHRGLSHSLAFAAALALLTVAVGFRRGVSGMGPGRLGLFLFLATASHGLLDTLTNGGLGVALLAPFKNDRYFFPFRPIEVSPIGIHHFLASRIWPVVRSEILWVWIPAALLALLANIALWLQRERGLTRDAR
jgi:inner membrane protein